MSVTLENPSFAKAHEVFQGAQPNASLDSIRLSGVAGFNRLGLPTRRLEEWRYTNLKTIAKSEFQLSQPGLEKLGETEALPGLDAYSVTVRDGVFQSCSDSLPEGVSVVSLAQGHSLVSNVLGKLVESEDAMTALNTAFLEAGVVVHVAKGTSIEKPLHLDWVVSQGHENVALHPRLVVVLEDNAHLNIIETYRGVNESTYLNNIVSEIALGAGANLEHTKLQEESANASHLAQTYVQQNRDSQYRAHLFNLGAKIGRSAINLRLMEPGASCYLGGLYMIAKKQHADVYTKIEHVAPHCNSQENYKGILDDSATSVFNGYVLVQKEAQKTDSSQQNRNLILSKNATANTRPQLEIYADDVKCAHGATVGQLDEDQIFYMRARGISLEQARSELTYGFAMDVLSELKVEAASVYLEKNIREQLLNKPVNG
ncbi:MAG: Fe-S cluster assembly protein SufD [Deltaproteobacteria bacterium]|jgi:Fe-S cluster assembly protein SufD|nr:Fe-S cluster assembly protein SufD [Deltaproteobacteria bacterium]MBT6431755.1 Fe-S cluster assembly protein SufD [Deltaproteobacteria bacterium]MBT6489123.1 Fe-S cluster assembly protein SufD [Deltaproteobacteria bacterium]